jgi:hypothetical protein
MEPPSSVASSTPDTLVPQTACGNGESCGGSGEGGGFVKWYRHYRTGELMIAAKYGYKAWPFGPKK